MGGFRDKQGGILMAVRFLDPRKSEAGVATVAGGVDGWKRAAGAGSGCRGWVRIDLKGQFSWLWHR